MEHVTEPFKVAAVEFNPEMFEFDRNLTRACEVIDEAAAEGARLIVLPEAALSGYIYRDLEQFLPYMDTVPGKGTDAISELTATHNCYVAIGIAEVDKETGLTYNTGALIGPDGYIGKYRKNGLNPSDINWFVPGNTGYPVFDTELGKICMIICYDDTYWEPGRISAVKGADIIAYICSSDRVLPELTTEAKGNHSTIAAVAQLSTFNGLAMVAADRNNAESNPTTGVTVTYGGCASIWQADGERIAHAPATTEATTAANPGTVLYAELDPALFENDQKTSLERRRPELYGLFAFFRSPTDGLASKQSHDITVSALQYRVEPGDTDGNIGLLEEQVEQLLNGNNADGPGLVVLPAFSISGLAADDAAIAATAESALGRTAQVLTDIAGRTQRYVVGSHVERDGDNLFHTAVLIAPDGQLVGSYRQTHLDPETASWATAGDDLAVFDTDIGRIGMLLCEDVRYPEAAGVLSAKRADLLAVPSHWTGQYGSHLQDAGGLFAHQYPENTMTFWYATAKTNQLYTVTANPVDDGCQGSSGVFSINPVDSDEPPVVASIDQPEVVSTRIATLGDPSWWMNQQKLVGGRRADLAVPLTLPTDSDAFTRWRDNPGFDTSGWTAYQL